MSVVDGSGMMVSAAFCCGAFAGAQLFHKISHVAEYTLNKWFGEDVQKTKKGDVIVSMSPSKDYFRIRMVAQFSLIALISVVASKVLDVSRVSDHAGISLMAGGLISSGLLALFNIHFKNSLSTKRWVRIINDEAIQRQIGVEALQECAFCPLVYFLFGKPPEVVHGTRCIHDK